MRLPSCSWGKVLAEKDKTAALKLYANTEEYSLLDSVTEILRLKGKLDVRGMIEEIEDCILSVLAYSSKRPSYPSSDTFNLLDATFREKKLPWLWH